MPKILVGDVDHDAFIKMRDAVVHSLLDTASLFTWAPFDDTLKNILVSALAQAILVGIKKSPSCGHSLTSLFDYFSRIPVLYAGKDYSLHDLCDDLSIPCDCNKLLVFKDAAARPPVQALRGAAAFFSPATFFIEESAVGNITERRAEFVYEAARLAAQAADAPVVPAPWAEREEPFRKQFEEVIERQCSERRSRSPEELHGGWVQAYIAMGWKYGPVYCPEDKVHPDIVPYAELGQLERDKDSVFIALCEIARQWIYDV